MSDGRKADTEALIQFLKEHAGVEVYSEGRFANAPFVVTPASMRLFALKEILDQYREHPEGAIGFSRHATLGSFMAHVVRHAEAGRSVVFLDPSDGEAIAIYDYHREGTTGRRSAAPGGPGWCRHGAVYGPEFSREWDRWGALDGQKLTGEQFAQLLEDNIVDVVADPTAEPGSPLAALLEATGGKLGTPSQLMALATNLEINANVAVNEVRRLSTGEGQIAYSEVHRDGAGSPVMVPQAFVIAIPVFRGGVRRQVVVRLRYRLASSRIVWTYDVYRRAETLDAEIAQVAAAVAEATKLPVFLGTREPEE